jgi:hypothetical protein
MASTQLPGPCRWPLDVRQEKPADGDGGQEPNLKIVPLTEGGAVQTDLKISADRPGWRSRRRQLRGSDLASFARYCKAQPLAVGGTIEANVTRASGHSLNGFLINFVAAGASLILVHLVACVNDFLDGSGQCRCGHHTHRRTEGDTCSDDDSKFSNHRILSPVTRTVKQSRPLVVRLNRTVQLARAYIGAQCKPEDVVASESLARDRFRLREPGQALDAHGTRLTCRLRRNTFKWRLAPCQTVRCVPVDCARGRERWSGQTWILIDY